MKFISSFYKPETGESTVVLQHLGKKFVGHSKIHPDESIIGMKVSGIYSAATTSPFSSIQSVIYSEVIVL